MKYCPVEKKCGGCQYLQVDYFNQLKNKEQILTNLFHKKVDQMIGMDDPYHYRHKVFGRFYLDKNQQVKLGLYQESTHRTVASTMCLIQHTLANQILTTLGHLATQFNISVFDERKGIGVLRHAYIRISSYSKDVLLVLVIGDKILPHSKQFMEKLLALHPEIKTVILNYNAEFGSMVLGTKEKVIYGKGYITDKIDDISFRISSKSFFQVNPLQAKRLYQTALSLAKIKKSDIVLDMCCGTGTISLLASRYAKQVIGVEIVEQAVKDAIYNAKQNHINNVFFCCDDATNFMNQLLDTPDVCILDPSRVGLKKEFMLAMKRLSPKKIIYISCNPHTQADDLKWLEKDYQIKHIVGVDMFPFTQELESIIILEKN